MDYPDFTEEYIQSILDGYMDLYKDLDWCKKGVKRDLEEARFLLRRLELTSALLDSK